MGQFAAAYRRSPGLVGDEGREAGRRGSPAAQSLDEGDAAARGLLAGLQSIGRAAALLDRDGGIVGLNALARPFADMLVDAAPGRVSGRSRSAQQRVRDILDVARGGGHAAREQADAAVLTLPDGELLIVRATAIGMAEPILFRRAAVLVQFTKLGFDLVPDLAFLRAALGLTATEAEVALALVGGASASAIARTRAVSLETIRSHLKTIFAKTGTRRQAHLVALILQLRDVAPS